MSALTDQDEDVIQGFLREFGHRYRENYQRLLNSGAEEITDENRGIFAKCVLKLTANGFNMHSDEGRRMLENLSCF